MNEIIISIEYMNISIRVTHPDLVKSDYKDQLISHYKLNISTYLSKFTLGVTKSTGGLHLAASQPHFHYHLQCPFFKAPSNANGDWKYFWNKKSKICQNKEFNNKFSTCPMVHKNMKPGTTILEKHINVSLKFTPYDDGKAESPQDHLAYPLKEKNMLIELCCGIPQEELNALMLYSNNLYLKALQQRAASVENQEEKVSKYQLLVDHIDDFVIKRFGLPEKWFSRVPAFSQLQTEDLHQAVFQAAQEYYVKLASEDIKNHVHPRCVIFNVEKYLFSCNHFNLFDRYVQH